MNESQRHHDAFEKYFQYKQEGKSTDEAITLLQVELGFSKTSFYKWKKEFDWDGREAIRADNIRKKVTESTDQSIVDIKSQYLGIVNYSLNDYNM